MKIASYIEKVEVYRHLCPYCNESIMVSDCDMPLTSSITLVCDYCENVVEVFAIKKKVKKSPKVRKYKKGLGGKTDVIFHKASKVLKASGFSSNEIYFLLCEAHDKIISCGEPLELDKLVKEAINASSQITGHCRSDRDNSIPGDSS